MFYFSTNFSKPFVGQCKDIVSLSYFLQNVLLFSFLHSPYTHFTTICVLFNCPMTELIFLKYVRKDTLFS